MARAPSTEGDSPIHGDAAGSPAGLYGIALKTCSAELERLVSAVAAVGEPCPPGPPPRDWGPPRERQGQAWRPPWSLTATGSDRSSWQSRMFSKVWTANA